MNAREFYEAGQLQEAIKAQNDEVKSHPTDTARRGFLCELLCFAGNLDRADVQLDTLGKQDSQAMMGIAMFRHLVRAELSRQQFFADGRVPEFLDQPSAVLQRHLQASIQLREGNLAEAVQSLTQAEAERPRISGECNGKRFADFRDLDDLTSSFFEVLTTNGKYYWIPTERVEMIEFREPVRPRDLLWQRVHMVVTDGPDGEVYLPTVYAGTQATDDDPLRLGRATDWQGGESSPVRGVGQRTFLVGDEAIPILELKTVTFDRPA